jgi:histidinol-phosphate aminotransferase
VAAHRIRRPTTWRTVETLDLGAALAGAKRGEAVLLDALGPWLAARMDAAELWCGPSATSAALDERDAAEVDGILAELDAFWDAAAAHDGGPVVVVADESGLGILPGEASSRRWLDVAGDAVQRLAADADRVLLVVAGRSLDLPAGAPAPGGAVPRDLVDRHRTPAPPDLRVHGDAMAGEGLLDLAVNVHGDGPPAHVRAAMVAALDGAAAYPDARSTRAALAARHDRDPAEVLVTAGAAELFWLLPRVARVALAAVVHPSFTEPEAALRAAGVPVTHVLRDADRGWHLDPAAVPDAADLVVLGNPSNPTGTLEDPAALAALCRPGRLVVVDEAFIDFVADPAASLAGRADLPGLVVVRSATKLWGLAGVRAGYALAPAGLVRRLDAARQPWPVGVEALAALRVIADDEAHRRAVAAEVAGARADLLTGLAEVPGVTAWDGAANFVLLRVPEQPGGRAVAAALRERGIAVRTSTFPGLSDDHLRVAVRGAEVAARLTAALTEILHQPARPGSRPS